MSDRDDIYIIVLAAICVLLAIALFFEKAEISDQRAAAIERGYALYCPVTGNWAWKGECDD